MLFDLSFPYMSMIGKNNNLLTLKCYFSYLRQLLQ
jgi:hypothetical protein